MSSFIILVLKLHKHLLIYAFHLSRCNLAFKNQNNYELTIIFEYLYVELKCKGSSI